MTTEQKKDLENLFTRYGSPSDDMEIRVTGYFQNPESLDDLDRVALADKNAERVIEEMQERIRQLTAYRVALAERYNYLATAPSVPVVRLTRKRDYYGKKVFYFLCVYTRNLLDGHEVQKRSTKYAGTERSNAINDFNSYVKTHPGIIAEMQIDIPKWER